MTLDDARDHIGARVTYCSPGGPSEDGTITSVNDHYVFVRYDNQHPAANGQATIPGNLDLVP